MNLSPLLRCEDTPSWSQNHMPKWLPNFWPTRFVGNRYTQAENYHEESLCIPEQSRDTMKVVILPGYLVASKDQIAKFIFDLQTPRWLAQTRKSLEPQNSWAEQAAC